MYSPVPGIGLLIYTVRSYVSPLLSRPDREGGGPEAEATPTEGPLTAALREM